MARLATAADLAVYLGETFDATATARAEMLLDMASAVIRKRAGQEITAVADDVVTLDGNGRRWLFLPQIPVTEVTSVEVDGTPLVLTDDYTWGVEGTLRHASLWPVAVGNVEVTYSHGYADVPDDIKAVCVQVASRGYANPSGLRSESIGSYSYSAAIPATGNPTGLALTDDEAAIVDNYRQLVFA